MGNKRYVICINCRMKEYLLSVGVIDLIISYHLFVLGILFFLLWNNTEIKLSDILEGIQFIRDFRYSLFIYICTPSPAFEINSVMEQFGCFIFPRIFHLIRIFNL